ncbi:MAG: GNAT family N-acetyltransferase [bacterium]|nr:GNAT family N-acetyltransferase [bacterium]
MTRVSSSGQPIGPDLSAWRAPPTPSVRVLRGEYVTLAPLDTAVHGPGLAEAFANAPDSLWTYMPFGPFAGAGEVAATLEHLLRYPDWLVYAATVDGRAVGFLAYLRIDARAGVIEIGSIAFSPALQRTTAATEAIYLLLDNVFGLGYRRCEWKCDALNAPSRSAAERLGFQYEGTFRNATHYKGRSRDTAWFAITNDDWPQLMPAYQNWLAPDNHDQEGRQRQSLRDIGRT